MSSDKRPGDRLFPLVTVFCVACATLLLQIIQTRIYAVVFWNHVVYLIISVALLGFGISGTWLAFGKDTWFARRLTIPVAAAAFVVVVILSGLWIPQWGTSLGHVFTSHLHLLRLLATYTTAILPYFFIGWILGILYREHTGRIHSLYFADLAGGSVGCFLAILLIRPLGAINLVLLAAALVVLPIFLFESLRRRYMLFPLLGAVVLLAAHSFYSKAIDRRILPDQTKSFFALYQDLGPDSGREVEFSEWSILARTDVVGTKNPPHKRIFIDGAACTGMVLNPDDDPPPFNPDTESLIPHKPPYLLHRNYDKVLVIGSGGGADVWNALRAGANRVDAVEINSTTCKIVQNEYREATNNLFFRPGVTPYNAEGRSFVRSTDVRYDAIIINAIDTFAALNSGAYMLAENYLYTVDAITDYLGRLTPSGVLCITRWDYAGETPRLFAIMLEALYQAGYTEPEKHIVSASRDFWTAVMISPAIFSEEEIALLKTNAVKHGGAYYYPLPSAEQFRPFQKDLNAYAEARHAGAQEAFFKAYNYNVRPVYDDSPFFFHYEKAKNLLAVFREKGMADFVRGHWPSFMLALLLLLLSVALFLFIFVPLMVHGRSNMRGFARWLVYFCLLGFSFIFVEICLMQRFSLLLGSPARSLAWVLAALLLSAGIGSYLRERLSIPLEAALGILVALLLVVAFLYPHAVRGLLGYSPWIRQAMTVLLVAPAGFFMGMPFPSGLKLISATSNNAVPWMWGVNGGATVLGSVLAIALAIYFGFTVVLLMAAAGYCGALVLYMTRAR